MVQFDPERPRISITGARLDWNSIAKANRVMVQFDPKRQRISITGEDESYEDTNGLCYCRVQTTCGVLVSVTKADICGFSTDAVVNAANEDLQHIGGLALALPNAAGPRLQQLSNDYIASRGRLRPGDAIVTDACNLPCKYVVHAVGPRFSNSDKRTAVSHLKLAVRESLNQAVKANCCTVALPAISSGVFGFPIDLCAQTIAQAVREYCDSSQGLGITGLSLFKSKLKTYLPWLSAPRSFTCFTGVAHFCLCRQFKC
uniref:Macro domain-containing protein n=1 Tax=Monopterus albus TaxID=43700 RepID=A0A3Q3IY92_MONAL